MRRSVDLGAFYTVAFSFFSLCVFLFFKACAASLYRTLLGRLHDRRIEGNVLPYGTVVVESTSVTNHESNESINQAHSD